MEKKKSILDCLIDGIAEIILPLVPILTGSGIMKGILAILSLTGVLSSTSDTYLVLDAVADCAFYFLPVMLAATSSKMFGVNQFTAIAVGCVLLYPTLTAVLENGQNLSFLGIPMRATMYHSSLLPIVMAIALVKYLEKFFNKVIPELLQSSLAPICTMLVGAVVTLLVFGPLGGIVGDGLAWGYEKIYQFSPVMAGVVLGAAVQPMVIFGFHWSLLLIAMNNVAVNGTDTILPLLATGVFAQVGATFAVFLKAKTKKFRAVCVSAMLSAIFGVTEPAMLGINLPLKKPMIAVIIGAGTAGILSGMSGVKAMAFALPSLCTLPVYFSEGFGLFLAACILSAGIAFVIAYFMNYDVSKLEERE